MLKKNKSKAMILLLTAAVMTAWMPGVSAEQVQTDQRTQAQLDAVRLLLDQGVPRETVSRLGPKAEVAAYLLKTRQPSPEALNKFIDGLAICGSSGFNRRRFGGRND